MTIVQLKNWPPRLSRIIYMLIRSACHISVGARSHLILSLSLSLRMCTRKRVVLLRSTSPAFTSCSPSYTASLYLTAIIHHEYISQCSPLCCIIRWFISLSLSFSPSLTFFSSWSLLPLTSLFFFSPPPPSPSPKWWLRSFSLRPIIKQARHECIMHAFHVRASVHSYACLLSR